MKQALRVMLAVLPKKNSDDISGELFVAAYNQKLSGYCAEQISFLADKAMERCKWFPTIAECIEIIYEWRRNDGAVKRKELALSAFFREQSARLREEMFFNDWLPPVITQESISTMSDHMISIGLGCKALRKDDDGVVKVWFTKPGEEEIF